MEALDRRYFNCAVQALGLPHGPGVGWFGQAVRHAVCPMAAVTTAPIRQELVQPGRERHRVTRPDGIPFTGWHVAYAPQKFGGHDPFGPRMQPDKRHITGPARLRLATGG